MCVEVLVLIFQTLIIFELSGLHSAKYDKNSENVPKMTELETFAKKVTKGLPIPHILCSFKPYLTWGVEEPISPIGGHVSRMHGNGEQ